MDLDINEVVRVKLTDIGRAAHAADHSIFCLSEGRRIPYKPVEEDAQGYSEWQLWELMAAFGNHLGNGFDLPFDQIIKLEPKINDKPSTPDRDALAMADAIDPKTRMAAPGDATLSGAAIALRTLAG